MNTHSGERNKRPSPLKGRKVGPRPAGWVNPRKGKPSGRARPLEDRFWEKVNKDGPVHPVHGQCWVWTGSINARGYPQLLNGKSPNGHPYPDVAHRISYVMHKGEIPVGFYIDHICQNKPCVNPAHLRAVTPTVSALENNESPFAKNARLTHCRYGHALRGHNIVWHKGPRDYRPTRICLTCRPWMKNSRYVVDPPK